MATVLVIGASKGIGHEAVKAALEAGHAVRAMARSARSIRIRHPNLEKISGDALHQTAVKAALEGTDAVVQTLGVAAGPGMMLKPIGCILTMTLTNDLDGTMYGWFRLGSFGPALWCALRHIIYY